MQGELNFQQKVFFTLKVLLVLVGVSYFLVNAFDLLLLIFASILVAIFLNGIALKISEKTGLGQTLTVIIILLLGGVIIFGVSLLALPPLIEQGKTLKASLPDALQQVQKWLQAQGWSNQVMDVATIDKVLAGGGPGVFNRISKIFSGAAIAAVQVSFIFIMGVYLALNPQTYRDGLLRLFPKNKRSRLKEVLNESGSILRWWLIGRFIDMAFIGVLVWLGLYLLDIPLAFILALIASVTNFIPNIGPFIGAIPALMVALTLSPQKTLFVILLYTVIQSIESVLLTPIIQQKVIKMAPALTISAQIIFGAFYGTIGIAVATPLLAFFIILIKRLYINDVLQDT
jgi:predicted PurR-regulated permease PerM